MKAFLFLLLVIISISCRNSSLDNKNEIACDAENYIEREYYSLEPIPDHELTGLKPCDILVKPNLNWLPGTTAVPLGIGFGHAAIVILGAEDLNEHDLLAKALTFESQARDVADEYQVRQVLAFMPGEDYCYANYNFNPSNLGRYYRLRLDLTDQQRQAIVDYLLKHDQDLSSPRAWKKHFPETGSFAIDPSGSRSKEYWYCSLIIWQAFYEVLNIDLDANKGLFVYPNDLVNSPYFNDEPGKPEKRIRF